MDESLRDRVIGEYQFNPSDKWPNDFPDTQDAVDFMGGHTYIFRADGIGELYWGGKKLQETKWSIVNGEIHDDATENTYPKKWFGNMPLLVYIFGIVGISVWSRSPIRKGKGALVRVFRINQDKSITEIADIRDGKRTDHSEEEELFPNRKIK